MCVLAGSLGVLVSPLPIGFLGGGLFSGSDSDCEFVEPQSFSFSGKRCAFLVESQGDMSMAGSPEEVSPLSRRRTQKMNY